MVVRISSNHLQNLSQRRWYQLTRGQFLAAEDKSTPLVKHPLVKCELKVTPASKPARYKWAQPKVVIVGAGMAGLTTAWRLDSLGFKDIVILEALNRPGGRIHTLEMGGGHVDLGSGNLYGCAITNPLYNLLVRSKVVDHRLKERVFQGPYLLGKGRFVHDIEAPYQLFKKAVERARILSSASQRRQSIKEIVQRMLQENVPEGSPVVSADDFFSIVNGLVNDSGVRWGEDLGNLSADFYGISKESSQKILNLNKIGGKKLLEPFLSTISKKIRYGKPVQSIHWRSEFLAGSLRGSVLCCDGEEFQGDFVVCTVSLGVMKARAATLFSPPLVGDKLHAIDSLGFGTVNKVFLEYERPFWIPGEGDIKVGWSQAEYEKRDSWLKGIGSIEEVTPTVLGFSLAGREAVWTETSSDLDIGQEFTTFLRGRTGNPGIPCPKSILRSRWSSDVFFSGSLGYIGLESEPRWQDALATPLPDTACPVLLFAGDQTVSSIQASMSAAVASGLREADRVVEVCHRFRGPPRQETEERLKPCPATIAATAG